MEHMEQEALVFIHALERMYLEQQDIENVLDLMCERTSWIGVGKHEICKSLSDATQALFAEKEEYKGGFIVKDSWYKTELLLPDACIIFGEFWADPKGENVEVAPLHQRVSMVCAKTDSGTKVIHLHMSNPDDDLEDKEFFVKNKNKSDNRTLKYRYAKTAERLQLRNQEMEILTSNIPGGVHQTKNDKGLTILSMSNGFIKMFGYSQQEISEIFDNQFMNMIYEKDREEFAKSAKEQFSVGETMEFEYRVLCKNGKIMWVLDRGRIVTAEDGTQTLFCIMVDITDRKEEQEKMRLLLEHHKIIMDQTTDILFEWDIETDTIDFSANWEKKFGYKAISSDISQKILLSENIHPEDMKNFIKIMQDTIAGIPYSETEFRISNTAHEYTWCRIRATTQYDDNNKPVRAVGVIIDIDSEKNRSRALQEAAQRDGLTKLYNKSTTKSRIEKTLANSDENTVHAMMIIDVDNFKAVNDTYGHQCGDAVLSNMAIALKKLFRATDIIGRIGGDEFLAFMPNLQSCELAAVKAKAIVEIFKGMNIGVPTDISCSVGVALYPTDANDYPGLSHCADSALYKVKKSGKVDFAFYEKDMQSIISEDMVRTVINNEQVPVESTTQEELIQNIFGLLYNAKDLKLAINKALEVVGHSCDVSRMYVFESSKDGKSCSNTFEWCNSGIKPQINNLQNLSYQTDLKGIFDLYDENGVFYCQDITTIQDNLQNILKGQDISAVLQCLIRDNGIVKGYVGFDECKKNRFWTKEQINTLTMVANMLSMFLTREQQRQENG